MTQPEREALRAAAHDAIARALLEAGIKNEVLLGMCFEVGLEAFDEALALSPPTPVSGEPTDEREALPDLPEAAMEDVDYELWGQNAVHDRLFTAEQMRQYALLALSHSDAGERAPTEQADRISLAALRRVIRGWHERAVALGFDGVNDLLGAKEEAPHTPPLDDLHVAIGSTRFSDGKIQTKASWAAEMRKSMLAAADEAIAAKADAGEPAQPPADLKKENHDLRLHIQRLTKQRDDLADVADPIEPPADAMEQMLGLYAIQADKIRAMLDEFAPQTVGNIVERIGELLAQPPVQQKGEGLTERRARFETWMTEQRLQVTSSLYENDPCGHPLGKYLWQAWQAALASPSPSVPEGQSQADIFTLADKYGTRWRSSDEEGMSFEKSALLGFVAALQQPEGM